MIFKQIFKQKKKELIGKSEKISFFINFLAVVLGIAITFGGEAIISHRQERKDLEKCLELVVSELQSNREYFHCCDSLLRDEANAAGFLIKYQNDFTKAPEDTLNRVANTPLTLQEVSTCTDAFELLKNSGVLTKISDKNLALEIFQTYGAIEQSAKYLTMFYEHKLKYLESAMTDDVVSILAGDDVTAVSFWTEMVSTKEGKQFLREILRFLSTYDPSDFYATLDSTVEAITRYCR